MVSLPHKRFQFYLILAMGLFGYPKIWQAGGDEGGVGELGPVTGPKARPNQASGLQADIHRPVPMTWLGL